MLPDLILIVMIALYVALTTYDIIVSIKFQRKLSRRAIYASSDPDERLMKTLTRSATTALRGSSFKRAISRRPSVGSLATTLRDLQGRKLPPPPPPGVPEASGGSWAWPRPADNPRSVVKPSPSVKAILRHESGASEPARSGPRNVPREATVLDTARRGSLTARTMASPGGGQQRIAVPLGEGVEEDHDYWSDDDDKEAIIADISENIKRYGGVRHGDDDEARLAGLKKAMARLAGER
jgi:hypothetical protein